MKRTRIESNCVIESLASACDRVQRAWVGDGVEMGDAVDACMLALENFRKESKKGILLFTEYDIRNARGEERKRAVEFIYDRSPKIAKELMDSYITR
jgi:hypothetical protein